MKHIIIAIFFISSLCTLHAQTSDSLSQKLAKRLQDSLSLNDEQTLQLQTINRHLHARKLDVWQQFDVADSIKLHLQVIENTRDTLYREVLSEEQFLLYLQRKRSWLNNN